MLSTTLLSLGALLFTTIASASCTGGMLAGTDAVTYMVPHNYDKVMGVVSDFKNLTWSGNTPETVTLHGPNNKPGTTRSYSLSGIDVVETLISYDKPACPGPYSEVHSTAPVTVPGTNLSAYISYDSTVVRSRCRGRASLLNMTAHFCSNDPVQAGGLLHSLHLADMVQVGVMLGNETFKGCGDLWKHHSVSHATCDFFSGSKGRMWAFEA